MQVKGLAGDERPAHIKPTGSIQEEATGASETVSSVGTAVC